MLGYPPTPPPPQAIRYRGLVPTPPSPPQAPSQNLPRPWHSKGAELGAHGGGGLKMGSQGPSAPQPNFLPALAEQLSSHYSSTQMIQL